LLSSAGGGGGAGGAVGGLQVLRAAPFLGSVGSSSVSVTSGTSEPKLLVNSFSDDIPDRFEKAEDVEELKGVNDGSKSNRKKKPKVVLTQSVSTVEGQNEIGILETFNNDPLKAKASVLSSHNWTVSRNTHIVWIGHLAWQQVTSLKSSLSSSSFMFPLSFASSPSHYPYPSSSLLFVATKKNSELKLLQKKLTVEKNRIKEKVKSLFSVGKKKSYATCQLYSNVVSLPEYLINILKEHVQTHPSSTTQSSGSTEALVPAPPTLLSPITISPSPLPMVKDVINVTDTVIHHLPEASSPTNVTSTASKMKSMLRSYFKFSNDSHIKAVIDHSVSNVTTVMKHAIDTTNTTLSSILAKYKDSSKNVSIPLVDIHHMFNNISLFTKSTQDLNYSANGSSLTHGIFNNDSHPIFSKNLSSSSLHHYYPSRYHYHNESAFANISSLAMSSSWNTTHRRQRRKLLFSMSSSSSSSSKHQIPKIFTTKSRMRTNKTSYSFSLSSFSVTSSATSLSPTENTGGCTPSLFLIGFLSTSYASYIANSLTSHPSILTGYDGMIDEAVEQQQPSSFYDKGCYNLLSEEITNSPSQATALLRNRGSCYPVVQKNESFLILDSSLQYNLNPFTPFLIKQVTAVPSL
jgi:hypothetical protein